MSLFSSLNVSLSGLNALSTQMQVVANNIANATTEGYTRKTAITQAVTLGGEGGGTKIIGFSRTNDAALSTTYNLSLSDYGLRSTQDAYLQQVESILGSTDSTDPVLSVAIGDFAAAWRQLASAPENNVCQRSVVQAASNLVSTLKTISASIDALDLQCSNDINNTLSDLNSMLDQIADLNMKISLGLSAGINVGNLQDERDLLIQAVSQDMKITVMERAQGQVALYTTGGYMLVDGLARSFSYDGTNITADGDTQSLNYALTGGKIQALLNFRATTTPASLDPATSVIQKLRSQIDEIVDAFTEISLGPPQSFACAYNGVPTATVTDGITFNSVYSGTFGNGTTVTIADTGGGTYSATIHMAGQDDEVYTGLTNGGSGFWANLADAINNGGGVPPSPASRLITATVNGTGTSTSIVGTSTLAGGDGTTTNGVASSSAYDNGVASTTILDDCLHLWALSSGAAGNSISLSIAAGSGPGLYTVTVTDGTTTEVYTDIADGGGGNAFWVNVATALNTGGGVPPTPASTLVSATAGIGAAAPGAGPYTLSGGGAGGQTCLTLTSLEAGTAGNNITATVSQGTNAGTYRVTIRVSGTIVETYDNIDNSGSGLWQNIADTINASSTRIMATAGTANMLPATGASTTYSFAGGTSELLTGFFVGNDASTFAVNPDLLDGTRTIKVVSPEAVGDAFNVTSRTFSADGLSVSNGSYESLAASILTGFQQAATNIASLSSTAESQKDYLQQRLTNETAVNVDSETVLLTTLQNSYAASAHVIQIINDLFDVLERL